VKDTNSFRDLQARFILLVGSGTFASYMCSCNTILILVLVLLVVVVWNGAALRGLNLTVRNDIYIHIFKYETTLTLVVTSFCHRQLSASEDTNNNREWGDLWLAVRFWLLLIWLRRGERITTGNFQPGTLTYMSERSCQSPNILQFLFNIFKPTGYYIYHQV